MSSFSNNNGLVREERPESISTSSLHMDILRDLKRIHSHIVAIAYPILEHAGKKTFLMICQVAVCQAWDSFDPNAL